MIANQDRVYIHIVNQPMEPMHIDQHYSLNPIQVPIIIPSEHPITALLLQSHQLLPYEMHCMQSNPMQSNSKPIQSRQLKFPLQIHSNRPTTNGCNQRAAIVHSSHTQTHTCSQVNLSQV